MLAFTESVVEEAAPNSLRCLTGLGVRDTPGPELATLRVGDAVRVSGKINQEQNGHLVNLEDCELRE